jgi:hypothetical protein
VRSQPGAGALIACARLELGADSEEPQNRKDHCGALRGILTRIAHHIHTRGEPVIEVEGSRTTRGPVQKLNGQPRCTEGGLEADIVQFAESLRVKWAKRMDKRQKAFKARVISLIRVHLPPFPKPSGRPMQDYITRATEMFAGQQREIEAGHQLKINWLPIAAICIPGFAKIRSAATRKEVIGRLQSSVYARWRAATKRRRITNSVD